MTSRLFSLFRMFPRVNAGVGPRPNSWAELALWRRFFQMKEEEEEEIMEMIVDVVGDSNAIVEGTEGGGYIRSKEAVEAREEFIRDGYRKIMNVNASNTNTNSSSSNASSSGIENSRERSVQSRRELEESDFSIPVGNGLYVTRAQ